MQINSLDDLMSALSSQQDQDVSEDSDHIKKVIEHKTVEFLTSFLFRNNIKHIVSKNQNNELIFYVEKKKDGTIWFEQMIKESQSNTMLDVYFKEKFVFLEHPMFKIYTIETIVKNKS